MGEKAKTLTTSPDSMATFYPPGYIAKNQAPEQYPARVIEALAVAQKAMRSKKRLNKVADKFFLANALIENRPDVSGGHGVINSKFSPREKDRFINTMMQLPASSGDEDVLNAYRYGSVFNDKTGRYANAVVGKDANDSQRISLWNGKGKAVEQVDWDVFHRADAQNHATKVMNLQKALLNKENKPLLDFFKAKQK